MGANDSKDISVFDHKTEPEEQEPELPLPPDRRGGSKDIPVDAYRNPKLDLFQSFVCNSEAERECLSNAMDLWDCIPRYSISRQEMNKRRDEKGNLPPLHLNFKYHGQEYTVIIFPTAILEGEKYVFYYPSAREELVEDALRKIALQQGKGFFEQNITRSGVAFSLYELRKELAARGHARPYQHLLDSLAILHRSHILIRCDRGEGQNEWSLSSSYLPNLATVTRQKLEDDPEAKWLAQFHPLLTRSLDQFTYRQFNYVTLMGLPTQLARWLYRQLSIKFTFASLMGNPFEMRYSTIKRDSNLLNCARERDNQKEVDGDFMRFVECGMLRSVQKHTIISIKGKIEDIIYQLYPTQEFTREVKAANKRQKDLGQCR